MFAVQQIVQTSTQFLFPPLCLHCQTEGTWLCDTGRAELERIEPCVNPLAIAGVDHVWCAGSYDEPLLARLVTGIKYHGWTAYQALLPTVLQKFPGRPELPSSTMIIPVPLHPRRWRWRGFNQAELVARALTVVTQLPLQPCLRRQRHTTPQAKLSAAARTTNIHAAFRLARGVETLPPCGILVDDVITTGNTIRECASVLQQAGMKHVIAVALAKG